MKSIDRYLSRDANYLLNVGPDGTGRIPEHSQEILRQIGSWYLSVKEAYDKVEPCPDLLVNKNILLTKRNHVLYVHLNEFPQGHGVKLKPLRSLPEKATLLNTGQAVECALNHNPSDKEAFLSLRNLPINELANQIPVIKLEFDRDIDTL